ncbi:MAG: hypothetical protein ACRERS_10875, partial [Methylococcales bacterium]
VGGVDPDNGFFLSGSNKAVDGGEGRLRRTAEDVEAVVLMIEGFDEFKTRIAAIEQEDTAGWDMREQGFGLVAFIAILDRHDGSGQWQAPKHIVGRAVTRQCGKWPLPGELNPESGSKAWRSGLVVGSVYFEPSKAITVLPHQVESGDSGQRS